MAQSNGTSSLQRISLQIKADNRTRWYNFLINPEDYEENHPQRTTTFKTREAVVVEDFGPDLGTIRFSGTTGFRRAKDAHDNKQRNGAERLLDLENFIEEYALSGYTTEPGGNPNNAEMLFYNRTDGKSWYVHLADDGFSIKRSAEESLLYRYTLHLVVLRNASTPSERDIDEAAIGNPISSVNNYSTSTHYINQVINPRSSNSVYGPASKHIAKTIGTANARDGVTIMQN